MPITDEQKQTAEAQQWKAAREIAPQVRLIAGPGTGKSKTVEKRVLHLLDNGISPEKLFAISFTNAASRELAVRISQSLKNTPHSASASAITVCTMHSLALRILRAANLLTLYPSDPTILDSWEQKNIYVAEMAKKLGIMPTRAEEIREAYDAAWEILDANEVGRRDITTAEQTAFGVFHPQRTNLYSCVLPGEVIFKCVENFEQGNMPAHVLPSIEHLIVDEFQDLNACDQKFVAILVEGGAKLFVAGDDDQSIYAFRHADPQGLVRFTSNYPSAESHELTDCFRCAPHVLQAASELIAVNGNRLEKHLVALYGNAEPPVMGRFNVWSFNTNINEARAIAQSCQMLIQQGMKGREDQILILLSQVTPSSAQLDPLAQELSNLSVPFSEPSGSSLTDSEAIHAIQLLLRIVREREDGKPDYPAHRGLLAELSGVGPTTLQKLADDCIAHNQNFHDLFYSKAIPHWLTTKAHKAVERVRTLISAVTTWSLQDSLGQHLVELTQLLQNVVLNAPTALAEGMAVWLGFVNKLPQAMTLGELLEYLESQSVDRDTLVASVNQRLGIAAAPVEEKRVRILTMHGAKGLSGDVVFIPGAAQRILSSDRNLRAAGLVSEQRRVFYVAITRARAACIVSHAWRISGASLFALFHKPTVSLGRSQYLNDIGIPSVNRSGGLTVQEARDIVADVDNL